MPGAIHCNFSALYVKNGETRIIFHCKQQQIQQGQLAPEDSASVAQCSKLICGNQEWPHSAFPLNLFLLLWIWSIQQL